jgi:hypothetical protein
MKINDKILRLVKHGLKATNLTKLNESQINSLYTRLSEQTTKPGDVIPKTTYEVSGVDTKKQYTITPNPKKPNTVDLNPVTEKTEIDEKSVSKKQHGLMGAAYSVEKGDKKLKDIPKSYRGKVEKVVDSMSKKQIKDFAKTKTKNLPDEVNETEYDLKDAMLKHAANYYTKSADKRVPIIGGIGESQLEKEITRLVEKHLSPKMTKKDFINIIENNVITPKESYEMNEDLENETELPSWLRWENISKK